MNHAFVVVLAGVLCGAGCGRSNETPKPEKDPELVQAQRLVQQMKNVDLELEARQQALEQLVKLGPKAVAPLEDALGHEDGVVRYHAVEALSAIGVESEDKKPVLAALERALADSQFVVRETATEGLVKLGPVAWPALGRALGDADPDVREIAATALAALKSKGLSMVLAAVADEKRRLGALTALAKLAQDGDLPRQAVGPVTGAMSDKNPQVRIAAAEMLGRLKAGVPQLTRALDDSDVKVRLVAAKALGELGQQARESVAGLLRLLAHPDDTLRRAAAESLGRVGPDAESAAFPVLLPLLDDPVEDVRVEVARALGLLGAKDPAVAARLIRLFKEDGAASVIQAAAGALGKLRAENAVPALIRAVRDPKRRQAAATALGAIGDRRGLPALIWALKHHRIGEEPDGSVRDVAEAAAGALGAMGATAVPTLRGLLRDQDEEVRGGAIDALGKIGAAARPIVQDLIRLMRRESADSLRTRVARALGAIGDVRAIPVLEEATKSKDHGLAQAATQALNSLRKQQKP